MARRNYGEEELRRKLLKKFPEPESVERVIKRLEELNYLNDEKFVSDWIEYRLNFKPRGRLLLRRELLAKGLNPDLVEKTLEIVYNRDRERGELKDLITLREKRYTPDRKGRNRLTAYLLRRGFIWQDIEEIYKNKRLY